MGRPLFSTLYVPAAPTVRVVEAPTPTCERWSYVNAFDPDADEFFEGDNCVYEDFLPLDESASTSVPSPAQDLQPSQESQPQQQEPQEVTRRADDARAPTWARVQRTLNSLADAVVPDPEDFPELISSSEDGSTASEASNSGRSTPAYSDNNTFVGRRRVIEDALSEQLRRARANARASASTVVDELLREHAEAIVDDAGDEADHIASAAPFAVTNTDTTVTSAEEDRDETPAQIRSSERLVHSVDGLRELLNGQDPSRDWDWPPAGGIPAPRDLLADLPMPASPRPVPARAVSPGPTPGSFDSFAGAGSPGSFDAFIGSPSSFNAAGALAMTPPGSVTPRFLTWGGSAGHRPRAVDMSPSPTPGAPFGSARALAYMAPPPYLRVQQ